MKKIKNFAWQMWNMVYIKHHAKSERTSAGWFEISFQKNEKKVSNRIWQNEKVCYIKLLSRFSDDRKQKWWSWKSLKKIQTSLDKLKKYAILRTRCPLNGDDLKEKNIKNSEVKNFWCSLKNWIVRMARTCLEREAKLSKE